MGLWFNLVLFLQNVISTTNVSNFHASAFFERVKGKPCCALVSDTYRASSQNESSNVLSLTWLRLYVIERMVGIDDALIPSRDDIRFLCEVVDRVSDIPGPVLSIVPGTHFCVTIVDIPTIRN